MENWNPWYGCHKCSEGCKNCYLESLNKLYDKDFNEVRYSSSNFRKLWKKDEYRDFIIPAGEIINVCETSDFFIEEGDDWRAEAWKMIKDRDDLTFIINTRRVERIEDSLPSNWGDGYDNVYIYLNIDNQKSINEKLPIFKNLKLKHKAINISPILEKIDIENFLDDSIESVSVFGEYGRGSRICNFEWVKDLREQCIRKNINFYFKSTGTNFLKDGQKYFIKNNQMKEQAKKANLDYIIK